MSGIKSEILTLTSSVLSATGRIISNVSHSLACYCMDTSQSDRLRVFGGYSMNCWCAAASRRGGSPYRVLSDHHHYGVDQDRQSECGRCAWLFCSKKLHNDQVSGCRGWHASEKCFENERRNASKQAAEHPFGQQRICFYWRQLLLHVVPQVGFHYFHVMPQVGFYFLHVMLQTGFHFLHVMPQTGFHFLHVVPQVGFHFFRIMPQTDFHFFQIAFGCYVYGFVRFTHGKRDSFGLRYRYASSLKGFHEFQGIECNGAHGQFSCSRNFTTFDTKQPVSAAIRNILRDQPGRRW